MHCTPTENCGTYYLHGVREFTTGHPELFVRRVKAAAARLSRDRDKTWTIPGIIIFSDARPARSRVRTKGELIASYIRKNGFGTVSTGVYTINPNTHNQIRCWVWNVNQTAMRAL